MSVNINYRPLSNESRWDTVKNGDFVILENTQEHPIPVGLYRVFIIPTEVGQKEWFITPLFDGTFSDGMFPYMVTAPLPKLVQVVSKLHIEVEQ